MVDFLCFFAQLLLERKDCHLDGCDCVVEMHDNTGVVFTNFFFVISVAEECKHHTFNTERRLDDVRHVFLVGDGVNVAEVLACCVDVLGEVIVSSVCDAPKFTPAKGEQEFKVGCCL